MEKCQRGAWTIAAGGVEVNIDHRNIQFEPPCLHRGWKVHVKFCVNTVTKLSVNFRPPSLDIAEPHLLVGAIKGNGEFFFAQSLYTKECS